jgi:hypothetical protein
LVDWVEAARTGWEFDERKLAALYSAQPQGKIAHIKTSAPYGAKNSQPVNWISVLWLPSLFTLPFFSIFFIEN